MATQVPPTVSKFVIAATLVSVGCFGIIAQTGQGQGSSGAAQAPQASQTARAEGPSKKEAENQSRELIGHLVITEHIKNAPHGPQHFKVRWI